MDLGTTTGGAGLGTAIGGVVGFFRGGVVGDDEPFINQGKDAEAQVIEANKFVNNPANLGKIKQIDSKEDLAKLPPGDYKFIVTLPTAKNPNGRLRLIRSEGKDAAVAHITLATPPGSAVATAGHIIIGKDGAVTFNDISGHYKTKGWARAKVTAEKVFNGLGVDPVPIFDRDVKSPNAVND